ncbi:MAG: type II toxin-antitoxin system RelE/ParE family toxin [bacterium]|nr:type II toxin-antitoxin system RelE/ParE family toxin [bacterium]
MIRSYRDKNTRAVAERRRVRKLPENMQRRAQVKLMVLNSAMNLVDLQVPPGNRLKALSGDRAGQYSIRINDQWRICFKWRDGDAFDVEIMDYH